MEATLETKEKEIPPGPASLTSDDVGEWIWVLFWRTNIFPDGTDRGSWDFAYGRVIGVGKRICYELGSQLSPRLGGDEEATPGSLLRFVSPEFVFESREAAVKAAGLMKPKK